MKKKSLSIKNANLLEIPQIFLDDIYLQLRKDLAKAGWPDFEKDANINNLNELQYNLHSLIEQIAESELEKLMRLLYIIDLPEEINLAYVNNEISNAELSKWLIIREWKKVEFRNHFS